MSTGPYKSIAEIRAANEAIGQVWFSKDSLAWFDSIIEPEVYGGRFFVTSERDSKGGVHAVWNGKRRWTIRRANADGTIDTVGEFGQFGSKAQATRAARAHGEAES